MGSRYLNQDLGSVNTSHIQNSNGLPTDQGILYVYLVPEILLMSNPVTGHVSAA